MPKISLSSSSRRYRGDKAVLHTDGVNLAEQPDESGQDNSPQWQPLGVDLAAIYFKHHKSMRQYANKVLPELLKSEVDVALMTVFARLVERNNRRDLKAPENWEAYLITAVHNACIDIIKMTKPVEEFDELNESIYRTAPDDPTSNEVTELLDQVYKQKLLEEALETLEPREREIVIEKYVNERSNTDIGKQFALTSQRVGQILKNALLRLREELKPQHD